MKKAVGFALCAVLSTMLVGCSSVEKAVEKVEKAQKEEDQEWIDKSADKIGKDITSGEFVIDGVVYEFPMDLQYWLDNGWHISNNYDNVDDFTLEPGVTSTEFELFNEDDAYVRVSVLNTSDENVTVHDCMVYSLYMSLTEVDAVFPQGITKRNKPDEILKAYGEPISKGDSSSEVEALYQYDGKDGWKCYAELNIVDNDYTNDPFVSVEYTIISFDDVWDSLVDSEGIDKACEIFLDTTMRASYLGDYADYVEYGIDSEEGAVELYESEVYYLSDCLIYYAGVNADYLSEEMVARFDEVALKALAKVTWNVKEVSADAFGGGTVVLELYPTNIFSIIEDDVVNAINQFYQKYENTDFDSMTDEEYAAVEEEYAESVLQVMESKVAEAGTLDAVEKEYELDMDGAMLSDDDWAEVDDIIMDVAE